MGDLRRDPDETAATLAAWLASRPGVDAVRIRGVSIPGSTG